MLSVTLAEIREKSLLELLFQRNDSRNAASAFLSWLKSKGGKCSKKEMSEFAHKLAEGELGVRLSRVNFYGTILSRFTGLGLIAEQLEFDQKSRKAIKVYKVVFQPVPKHKPLAPSLLYVAHVLAEKWNREISTSP